MPTDFSHFHDILVLYIIVTYGAVWHDSVLY